MSADSSQPLIVGFVADLMFTVRIENVARQLGFAVQWLPNAGELEQTLSEPDDRRPGEPLFGAAGALLDQLTRWQPALLIFDLGNDAIPWQDWLPRIKSSPATRRLPVLCYGPHVESAALRRAHDLGADQVVARSRLASALPELIAELARIPDRAALAGTCDEPLAELAARGIAKMNAGQYYPAHDDLEEAWVNDDSPGRDLYRGILQITVAYYQIERGNYNGAVKMFLRARQWLDPLPDICRGVDVVRLRADASAIHEALTALGPERMAELDRQLLRPVRLAGEGGVANGRPAGN